MHCLAFPSALFGAPFHIDNRTVANCGFWLEYASKTPLEVGADLPRRMRLFWLRCQIMRLRSVHIKPHYSQNAFDSALLAWYERGISLCIWKQTRTILLESCLAIRGSRVKTSAGFETRGAEIKTRHKNESPIDFVHSSRPRSRPRQGKVKIETGLEPNIGQDSRERVVFNRNSLNFGAHLPCEQLCLANAVEEAKLVSFTLYSLPPIDGTPLISTPCSACLTGNEQARTKLFGEKRENMVSASKCRCSC